MRDIASHPQILIIALRGAAETPYPEPAPTAAESVSALPGQAPLELGGDFLGRNAAGIYVDVTKTKATTNTTV
jgi:hypothetical protein